MGHIFYYIMFEKKIKKNKNKKFLIFSLSLSLSIAFRMKSQCFMAFQVFFSLYLSFFFAGHDDNGHLCVRVCEYVSDVFHLPLINKKISNLTQKKGSEF